MNLDLVNSFFNDVKNSNFIQSFIKELQNYLDNFHPQKIEKEDLSLLDSTHNGNKIISKYRDKMLLERSNILNNYAKNHLSNGEMYYIYSKNSKMEDGYNLSLCEEGQSHTVIEEDAFNLPSNIAIGSVLRKIGGAYILDEAATYDISQELSSMQDRLLKEQNMFLESQRIEGHIYEMAENEGDRALLFDVTSNSDEGFEEIDFPTELLNESQEGDLFIYKNGKYESK